MCMCECVCFPACQHASDTQNSLPPFSLEQHKEICVTMPTDQSAWLPPPSRYPFWLPFPARSTQEIQIYSINVRSVLMTHFFKGMWVQIRAGIVSRVWRKCSFMPDRWFTKNASASKRNQQGSLQFKNTRNCDFDCPWFWFVLPFLLSTLHLHCNKSIKFTSGQCHDITIHSKFYLQNVPVLCCP